MTPMPAPVEVQLLRAVEELAIVCAERDAAEAVLAKIRELLKKGY